MSTSSTMQIDTTSVNLILLAGALGLGLYFVITRYRGPRLSPSAFIDELVILWILFDFVIHSMVVYRKYFNPDTASIALVWQNFVGTESRSWAAWVAWLSAGLASVRFNAGAFSNWSEERPRSHWTELAVAVLEIYTTFYGYQQLQLDTPLVWSEAAVQLSFHLLNALWVVIPAFVACYNLGRILDRNSTSTTPQEEGHASDPAIMVELEEDGGQSSEPTMPVSVAEELRARRAKRLTEGSVNA
ncbi:hypothetical protein CALCODRAFT_485722 [Calocera cornea HHB12733]|uniref:Uncharacterized protein n=1 Tax=Calocera cornea HHB12733 TaxID=1353952 RepID=A0A165E6J9_9BASI|nr:hypothetical protein CALCODRAFT_485722 [Calocera cornea HHB12733]